MKDVFAISVDDVQEVALKEIGRELTCKEMHQVKSGISWGFYEWEEVVIAAIEGCLQNNKNVKIKKHGRHKK